MRNQGRYLAEAPPAEAGDVLALPERESRHLLAVRRAEPGDRLELFDGRGRAWRAELAGADGGRALCRVLAELPSGAGRSWRLTVATAVPKPKRMSWLVEKCAELGVAELWPAAWGRSPRGGSDHAVERWRRLAEAAAKQSRQASLMEVGEPLDAAGVAARCGEFGRVLILEPGGGLPLRQALAGLAPGGPVLALVGPEGGLTAGDLAAVEAAAGPERLRRVTLGPSVLRVETAAVALAAAALCEGLAQAAPPPTGC
ncbi:MAG TPA: 16S rRNA (uracil(1498)-N(3))-methyltransferase [Planctomycetota bacterium]|nr:16S rRNA (uracil(1498)-N(3))-methyltransferase [Planctomycetota bacterium]